MESLVRQLWEKASSDRGEVWLRHCLALAEENREEQQEQNNGGSVGCPWAQRRSSSQHEEEPALHERLHRCISRSVTAQPQGKPKRNASCRVERLKMAAARQVRATAPARRDGPFPCRRQTGEEGGEKPDSPQRGKKGGSCPLHEPPE